MKNRELWELLWRVEIMHWNNPKCKTYEILMEHLQEKIRKAGG